MKRDVLAGAVGGAVDYVWDVLDAIASGSPIPPGLQFPDRKGGYAKSATTISGNQDSDFNLAEFGNMFRNLHKKIIQKKRIEEKHNQYLAFYQEMCSRDDLTLFEICEAVQNDRISVFQADELIDAVKNIESQIIPALVKGIEIKNRRYIDVAYGAFLAYKKEGLYKEYWDILVSLLSIDCHVEHENIINYLEDTCREWAEDKEYLFSVIEFALNHKPEYLNYSYAYDNKCIWALGYLCSEAAINKLKEIEKSDVKELAENASYQLERIRKGEY